MKVLLLTFILNLSFVLGFSATASVDKNRCTIDDIISFKIEFENADLAAKANQAYPLSPNHREIAIL